MVVNTHLDNSLDNKNEELADLFAAIEEFKGDIKFLCGDFNLLPTTEFYQKIAENWNDTYFEGKDLENKSNFENRNLETQRIDYIMAKKGENYRTKQSFFIMMIRRNGQSCRIIAVYGGVGD